MSEEKKNEVLGKEKELDESELESVAGGLCACAIAGSGSGNDKDGDGMYFCPCAAAGVGMDDGNIGSDLHCYCPLAGGGTDKAI